MNGHTVVLPELPDPRLPPEGLAGRIRSSLGASLDSAVLSLSRVVVERALIPDAADVAALRASTRALSDSALLEEPSRYFAFLHEPTEPLAQSSERRRSLPGGHVISRSLTSEYRSFPYGPRACDQPTTNSDPIRMEHWVHAGEARGTVVALHGFGMGRPRIDAVALFASRWYEMGLDVVLLTLPHHGSRTPPGARFSGECFAVPDVIRLGEAVREAVYELHVVKSWLRARGTPRVGLLGLSLGGYLAALCAGLMDDLDFVIPVVAPVCMGDLAWRFFEQTAHAGRGQADAITCEELRTAFWMHSPLTHAPRIPVERLMIVAGRGDRVVPAEHPLALWRHWSQPEIHWFSGSHVAPFGRKGVVRAVRNHLVRSGVLA